MLKKHPPSKPVLQSAIFNGVSNSEQHPILFERIDGDLIQNTATRTEGAAGPSGLDAAAWRRLCTSFKSCSTELCDALAAVNKRICTATFVDPSSLTSFVASRLIALDKCPGVRPIGIGEVARRIMGKAIATVIGNEIQEAAGPLQTCAGHLSGCEAAVHAMHQVFGDDNVKGVILVHATNAFNCLNRQTALINIKHLCPALSKVLINTYRGDILSLPRRYNTRRSPCNGDVCCCYYTPHSSPCRREAEASVVGR